MGIYVVLLLVSPVILGALNRGKAVWVLAGTLAVYAVGSLTRFRLLPSQFEDSFPLLVWQVLFVVSPVAGYHRRGIVAWLTARTWLVAACTAVALLLAFFVGQPVPRQRLRCPPRPHLVRARFLVRVIPT
jgi:hypothetical protein